jgi:hypothetical protein
MLSQAIEISGFGWIVDLSRPDPLYHPAAHGRDMFGSEDPADSRTLQQRI